MTTSNTPRPTGHSIQPYRSAAGYSDKTMVSRFPRWKRAGVRRVFRHGFYGEQTPKAFGDWAALVRAGGMDTGAVFGLGGWTRQHPDETGQAIGSVFAHPLCSMGGIDAEGAYDPTSTGPLVAQLGRKLRSVAPRAFIFDQPWPIILYHDGFPVVEFSEFVDEHDAQEYDDDFKSNFGVNRAPRLQAWSKQQWDRCEQLKLRPAGVVRPYGITLEGYGHDDNTFDMVDTYFRFPDSITWTEWEPAESTLMSMQAAEYMRALAPARAAQIAQVMADVKQVDDVRPMTASRAIVGVFQKENGLLVDYKAGYDTMAKMGIRRPGVLVSMFSAVRSALARAA